MNGNITDTREPLKMPLPQAAYRELIHWGLRGKTGVIKLKFIKGKIVEAQAKETIDIDIIDG